MKRTFVIAATILIATIVSISTFAQTRPAATPTPAAPQTTPTVAAPVPATKIAFVDTTIFSDEKAGIQRYVKAVKSVQGEFTARTQELTTLQTRLKTLSDEITKLSGSAVVSQESIKAKQEEGERLQRELKYKQEQINADYDKRLTQVVGPISTDIGKALDSFASQRGLTMILDISKLLPAVLTLSPAMDVTQSFIAEYNSKNP